MKQILLLLSLVLFQTALVAQVKTAGVNYSVGAPAWTPSVSTASELAIDTVSKRLYLWNRNTGAWDLQGQGIDNTSGGTPPAYTPGQTDSKFAINNASPPELYAWTGSAWAKVGGTIQIIDTFSVSGSVVSLSLSLDNQPAKTITLPASGITALTGDVTATGPGSTVATIAAGAVTGAKLASGAVSDSTKIGANVIEQSNIDNGAVWARHIARMGASGGQVLGWTGSIWGPTTITSGWGLTGNAATAGSSFLGTTNNVSLRFRTNNAQRMILDSLGNVGFGTNSPTERVHVVGSGYFTGDVRIGASTINATNLSMTRALTGATTVFAASLITTVQSDVLQGIGYSSAMATQATPFSTIIRHFYAQQGTFGAGSTVTQQAGFFAASNLIGATENYGFHGTIPSGTGRWNAYMSGTASNAFAGSTIIGATTTPAARLHVVGAGATSSTWTAQFHNSTGTNNALRIRDDGNVFAELGYTTGPSTSFAGIFPNTGLASKGVIVRGNLNLIDVGEDIVFDNAQGDPTHTSGVRTLAIFRRGFAPTSGTGEMRWAVVNPTVNQTGGASGASIGFLAIPTLTSAASWRSFEYRNNTGWGIYGVGTANNYIAGNTTIGSTNTPTDRLDITGANGYSQLRLRTAYTPTSTSDANGNPGDISWDENYFYVKTAAGWKRSALSTW